MQMHKLSRSILLPALVVLFFMMVALSNTLPVSFRVDLTENKLYTLSDGMRNLLSKLEEPVHLYLYFSEKNTQNQPELRNYYRRVLEILEEYRLYSDGKLIIHTVDPEPFSEEEDRATQSGLQAVGLPDNTKIYFGIVGTNTFGETENIPFLQPDKEVLLEYNLGQLIYSLSRTDKIVVGLMTTLPMTSVGSNPATGANNPSWVVTEQLERLFDVRLVFTDTDNIDPEVDLLLVVHPKNLSDKTQYAIDQFIMRGGKGLFFVDPYSETEYLPLPPGQPMETETAKSSNLNKLFRSWGFEADEKTVIGDWKNALTVSTNRGTQMRHLSMLGAQADDINQEDVVTEGLNTVNFAMASHIRLTENSEATLVPLIQTSRQAALIPLNRFRLLTSPQILEQGFQATGERYALAARISGQFTSAFEKPPEDAPEGTEHIAQSVEPADLIVVADTDLLTDRMWAGIQQFFGQRIVTPFASNRDFFLNAVDNLIGSNDLIGIKSRSRFTRPFTHVLAIEEKAERKFKDTEQKLQQELRDTEKRLADLQKSRTDGNSSALLTPEQQAEIEAFRGKQIETRKKLRNVRHQQTESIERLGTRLKIINIGVMPAIVVTFALLVGLLRVRSRNRRTV